MQFDGHSLRNPEPDGWAIKSDDGEFDQLTGASVTPRAIIKAIRETLTYFSANQEIIFAERPKSEAVPESSEGK